MWAALGNRVMLADNMGAEEEALYSMGRFDEVVRMGQEALEICEELDNAWGKSYHRLLMGLAHFGRGEVHEAIELMTKAIEMGDQGGLIISSVAGRCDLAWCYGSQGEMEKALELIEPAMELAKANLPDWVVMPVAMKVRLLARQGDRHGAEAAAAGVELVPPSLAYPHYTMMVELARIELARLKGDYQEMLAITDEVYAELSGVLPAEASQLLQYKAEAMRGLGRGEG